MLDRDLKLTLAESPTSHPRALRTDQHAGLALADITHNDATGDTPPR